MGPKSKFLGGCLSIWVIGEGKNVGERPPLISIATMEIDPPERHH